EMLGSWGMKPVLAESAARALALLEAARRDGRPFPLLLADVHMPQVDGFTLVARLPAIGYRPSPDGRAERDRGRQPIVVLMLTSGGQPGDAGRCRELGIRAYLSKPVKQSDLFDSIVSAFGTQLVSGGVVSGVSADATTPAPLTPQPSPQTRKLRVL